MAGCASATTSEEVEQIKFIVIFHGLVPVQSIFWKAICFKDERAWWEELLTEHALQWDRKKNWKAFPLLVKQYSKTKIQLSNAKEELFDHLKELHIPVDVLTVWQKEIVHSAQEREFPDV